MAVVSARRCLGARLDCSRPCRSYVSQRTSSALSRTACGPGGKVTRPFLLPPRTLRGSVVSPHASLRMGWGAGRAWANPRTRLFHLRLAAPAGEVNLSEAKRDVKLPGV